MLEEFWDDLTSLDDRNQLPLYVKKKIHPVWPDPQVTAEELAAKILTLLVLLDDKTGDLRPNEHMMLCSAIAGDEHFPEFQINPQSLPSEMSGYLSHLVSVERLREVRVLRGFSRLNAVEANDNSAFIAPLSDTKLNWLPAVEVRGEGIFINFDEEEVLRWEARKDVSERAKEAHSAAEIAWREHNGDDRPFPITISPRFLLVHTTAHALAEQLSLDSGYSTASIRERLYISSGPGGMCGFLLYTSAPDSDGTLGGLSERGEQVSWDRFWFLPCAIWNGAPLIHCAAAGSCLCPKDRDLRHAIAAHFFLRLLVSISIDIWIAACSWALRTSLISDSSENFSTGVSEYGPNVSVSAPKTRH